MIYVFSAAPNRYKATILIIFTSEHHELEGRPHIQEGSGRTEGREKNQPPSSTLMSRLSFEAHMRGDKIGGFLSTLPPPLGDEEEGSSVYEVDVLIKFSRRQKSGGSWVATW